MPHMFVMAYFIGLDLHPVLSIHCYCTYVVNSHSFALHSFQNCVMYYTSLVNMYVCVLISIVLSNEIILMTIYLSLVHLYFCILIMGIVTCMKRRSVLWCVGSKVEKGLETGIWIFVIAAVNERDIKDSSNLI